MKQNNWLTNRLLIAVFIIFASITSNAQSFELGVKAGFGLSNVHITNIPTSETINEDNTPTFSYSFNGTGSYKSKGFWGFSLEPGIVKKGWIENKEESDENILSMYFLQLPIYSDFHLSERFCLSIGPEINYLFDAKSKTKDNGKVDDKIFFKDFELSVVISATYNIFNNIDVGLKYGHGITQMSDLIVWAPELGEEPRNKNDYYQYLQCFIKIDLKRF